MVEVYMGTGRRKTATARIYLKSGSGKIEINGKEYNEFNEYFENKVWTLHAIEPLKVAGLEGAFDILIRVQGGGKNGQAGAVRLGLARALVSFNSDLKKKMRENGFLTRDPRMVERKKYGLKKSRRAPQFSKR